MSSSKKFTFKWSLWQVLIRVYRLEILSVMLVFPSQLCELLPPPPSLLCVNKYTRIIQCVGGGGGVWVHRRVGGLRQINTCRKVPSEVNFLDDYILLWCTV
jgi:hypothetical protein